MLFRRLAEAAGLLCCVIALAKPPTCAKAQASSGGETSGSAVVSAKAGITSGSSTIHPPPRRVVGGRRFRLGKASLFVPDFFDAGRTTGTEIVVFLHGAAWCAEQNFYDAHKNAVLVCESLQLGEYDKAFDGGAELERLIVETTATLRQEGITSRPVSQICVASFSGGYAGTRAILKSGKLADQITCLVLADSLYAGRDKDSTGTLDASHMKPFLDFAREAAEGRKVLLFTQLFPPEERYRGNTTTLAASYLMEKLGLARTLEVQALPGGRRELYRCERNGLHIFGVAGMTMQDHMEHFYHVSDLLRMTPLADAR